MAVCERSAGPESAERARRLAGAVQGYCRQLGVEDPTGVDRRFGAKAKRDGDGEERKAGRAGGVRRGTGEGRPGVLLSFFFPS